MSPGRLPSQATVTVFLVPAIAIYCYIAAEYVPGVFYDSNVRAIRYIVEVTYHALWV